MDVDKEQRPSRESSVAMNITIGYRFRLAEDWMPPALGIWASETGTIFKELSLLGGLSLKQARSSFYSNPSSLFSPKFPANPNPLANMISLQVVTILADFLLVHALPAHDRNASETRISRQVVVSMVIAIVLAIASLLAMYLFCKCSSIRRARASPSPIYIGSLPHHSSQRNQQPVTISRPAEVHRHTRLKAPAVGRGLK